MPRLVQHIELLEIAVGVLAASQNEVPGKQRATTLENLKNVGIGHAFIYTTPLSAVRDPQRFGFRNIELPRDTHAFLLLMAFVQAVFDFELDLFERSLQNRRG